MCIDYRHEWQRLLTFVEEGQGRFAIGLARCTSSLTRDRMIVSLGRYLSQKGCEIHVARLEKRTKDLFEALQQTGVTLASPARLKPIVIVGLEAMIVDVAPEDNLFLRRLNLERDRLRRRLQAPIVFWLSPVAMYSLQIGAPDFYDYWTGHFDFTEQSSRPALKGMPTALSSKLRGLGLSDEEGQRIASEVERHGRILESIGNLDDLQDPRAQLRACESLRTIGRGEARLGNRNAAVQYLSLSAAIGGQSGVIEAEAISREMLGNVLIDILEFEKARTELVRARDLYLKADDTRGVARLEQSLGYIASKIVDAESAVSRTSAGDLVFVGYSHVDIEWVKMLQTHLKPFVRAGLVDVWDDTRIRAGAVWRDEIQAALAKARVAVLLVSPDFLSSDFIAEQELLPLLEAASGDGLTIIWVPIRPSAYELTEIERYQSVWDPSKPLSSLSPSDKDAALVSICRKILDAASLQTSALAG